MHTMVWKIIRWKTVYIIDLKYSYCEEMIEGIDRTILYKK